MKKTEEIQVAPVRKKKMEKAVEHIKRFWPLYVMLAPLLVYLAIFNYYPMTGIQLAFKDYYIRNGIWGSPWATDLLGNLDVFKNNS